MSVFDSDEFRAMFAEESEMRLAKLGQLALELERTGATDDLVGSIFREVHTIKGAASVVGFSTVGAFAHAMEERLEDLRAGRLVVTPQFVDALLEVVDALAVVTEHAVHGSPDEESDDAPGRALARFVAECASGGERGGRPADAVTSVDDPEAVIPAEVMLSTSTSERGTISGQESTRAPDPDPDPGAPADAGGVPCPGEGGPHPGEGGPSVGRG